MTVTGRGVQALENIKAQEGQEIKRNDSEVGGGRRGVSRKVGTGNEEGAAKEARKTGPNRLCKQVHVLQADRFGQPPRYYFFTSRQLMPHPVSLFLRFVFSLT